MLIKINYWFEKYKYFCHHSNIPSHSKLEFFKFILILKIIPLRDDPLHQILLSRPKHQVTINNILLTSKSFSLSCYSTVWTNHRNSSSTQTRSVFVPLCRYYWHRLWLLARSRHVEVGSRDLIDTDNKNRLARLSKQLHIPALEVSDLKTQLSKTALFSS